MIRHAWLQNKNYYLKTNRYGIREDCASVSSGSTINSNSENSICLSGRTSYKGDGDKTYNYNRDWFTQGLSCYLTGNIYTNINAQNNSATAISGNYNPYNTEKIGQWYNFLAGSTNKILGWTVDYHLTDPDGKGIDKYLHEYQLFNIIDEAFNQSKPSQFIENKKYEIVKLDTDLNKTDVNLEADQKQNLF